MRSSSVTSGGSSPARVPAAWCPAAAGLPTDKGGTHRAVACPAGPFAASSCPGGLAAGFGGRPGISGKVAGGFGKGLSTGEACGEFPAKISPVATFPTSGRLNFMWFVWGWLTGGLGAVRAVAAGRVSTLGGSLLGGIRGSGRAIYYLRSYTGEWVVSPVANFHHGEVDHPEPMNKRPTLSLSVDLG